MKSAMPDKGLIQKYRNVFSGLEGQDVLEDLLYSLRYGRRIETPEDMSRHNAAVEILAMCGFSPEYLTAKSLMNDSVKWKDNFKESESV